MPSSSQARGLRNKNFLEETVSQASGEQQKRSLHWLLPWPGACCPLLPPVEAAQRQLLLAGACARADTGPSCTKDDALPLLVEPT